MSRIEHSLKNSATSLIIQLGTTLLNFVSRTVLIETLGEQYLGISGLFANILSMLSLAELGIGTTITYWLYEPMANNDKERLNVLMSVYARVYNILGIFVLALGLSVIPFLGFLMKEVPDIPYLTLIYAMYVVNMASTYFFVYKSTLINVAQKNYIVNAIKFGYFVLCSSIQILILLFARNYILYYTISIISSVCGNLTVSIIAEKMFPFLKNKIKGKLTKEEKLEIKKDISAIFFHNIGSFVLTGTDNMIISKFIGILEVGLYSNYTMIIHALQTLMNLIFSSLTSSVGNLINAVEKEKSYEIFKNVFFATSWLLGVCSVCLYVLFNPFIILWLGENFVFEKNVVFFIVLNFYLMIIRRPVNTFKHCAGLFRKDKYKPLLEAVINLIVSISLVKRLGICGVFIGTAVSTIVACMYVEPYILYKYFYKKNVKEYFIMLFKYFSVTVISAILIECISTLMKKGTFGGFVYQILLCMLIPNILFWLIFRKTSELRYFKLLVVKVTNKFLRR